jgi:hypothetical protein
MRNINELIGKTLYDVVNNGDELVFHCQSGETYKLYHRQDCCESVRIDDICGDLEDLVGEPILIAEEVSNEDFEKNFRDSFNIVSDWGCKENADGKSEPESCTWTFYKFATRKGYVDVRWFGESNGYYSESVDFMLVGVDEDY